jgi:flagellar hook-associated protein 3 FlgL
VIDDLAAGLDANRIDDVKRSIEEINTLHQGISLAQAGVGADLSTVESQSNNLEGQLIRIKGLVSDLQDVDYAEAVTRMQKEMLGLQAAQSSFAQLSKLSLFNYIG